MRIAVWRMGARFITSEDSTVGGGRIAEAVVSAIRDAGHDPVVVSKLKEASEMWLDIRKFEHTHEWRAADYDAVVVLTGPSNPMYEALYTTYNRLAEFEGPVIYAWYDAALGFEFDPQKKWSKFRAKSKVGMEDLFRNKTWTVLGQSPMEQEEVQFRHCIWELAECMYGRPLKGSFKHPRFGYFGSPRPARLRELKRWFGDGTLGLDLFGKNWKPDALGGDVRVFKPVKERMVRQQLNQYAATLYAADPVYIKTDFVAQRFIENAMAGVPVAYSDKLQPTIEKVIPDKWVFSEVAEMSEWFDEICCKPMYREQVVEMQRALVLDWAKNHAAKPSTAIKAVLK